MEASVVLFCSNMWADQQYDSDEEMFQFDEDE